MSNGRNFDPSTGQFIDPMFAVIIAAAISETVVQWVTTGPAPSIFEISVVSVGYVNLLLSWFGYHKSVLKKPIRGSLRFIITVILLPLYLLTIILFAGDFFVISATYFLIFFLWTIWEYFKGIEHGERKGFWNLQFRTFNIIIYSSTILQMGFFYFSGFMANYVSKATLDWSCLAAVAFSIVFLRVSKSAKRTDTPAGRIRSEFGSLFFGSANTEQANPSVENKIGTET